MITNRMYFASILMLLFLTAVASPVLASEQHNNMQWDDKNDVRMIEEQFAHFKHDGYDEKHHCLIQTPASYSGLKNLTIDMALMNSTPHWILLAAGKTEQDALLNFIERTNISNRKKIQLKFFLMTTWMKYPIKYVKTDNGAKLVPGKTPYKFSPNPQENKSFQEIEGYIAEGMNETTNVNVDYQNSIISPMWAQPDHDSFTTIACQKEKIPDDLIKITGSSSEQPDDWYNYPGGVQVHSLEHGYVPLGLPGMGIGFAPAKSGGFASLAQNKFVNHDYSTAFTNLGYATHFMQDLGQPYHTPQIQIIPLQFVDDPNYFKEATLFNVIINYQALHNSYEGFFNKYWSRTLPNGETFGSIANSVSDYEVITDPKGSAQNLAYQSWSVNPSLIYSCYWYWVSTGTFDFQNSNTIVDITKERVVQTERNTRGLVHYVTGGQPPMLTVTATPGPGGSITPSGLIPVMYGDSRSFTISPNPGYTIDRVTVNGNAVTLTGSTYVSPPITTDETISATFKPMVTPTPTQNPGGNAGWNWATDEWGDWQHTWAVTGTQVGINQEYGPVIVTTPGEGTHGEHGSIVHLNSGSTESSVWKTFTDPFGTGWNTITFKGLLQATDTLNGRWMAIYVNDVPVFGATAAQTPPGNGVPFTITKSFKQSPTVTVKISNGQNPAWGPQFGMHYYSLTLSRESSPMALTETQNEPFVIPDGSIKVDNQTTPIMPTDLETPTGEVTPVENVTPQNAP